MTRTILTIAALCITSSASGAQQAAIPTPPKTVNPLPQSTTSCRGCSDDNTDKKKDVGSYDRTLADSAKRKPAVAPTVASAKTKAKPATVKRKSKKGKTTHAAKKPAKTTSSTPSKAIPAFKDSRAVGDPIMRSSAVSPTRRTPAAAVVAKRDTTKK